MLCASQVKVLLTTASPGPGFISHTHRGAGHSQEIRLCSQQAGFRAQGWPRSPGHASCPGFSLC